MIEGWGMVVAEENPESSESDGVMGKSLPDHVLFFPEKQEDGWCTQKPSSLGRGLLALAMSCVTSGKWLNILES